MVEAATSSAKIAKRRNQAAVVKEEQLRPENKKLAGELEKLDEEDKEWFKKDEEVKEADKVLKFFNEISLLKGLKDLKKRESDALMRDEISMAFKCIKIKLNRLNKAKKS